MAAKVAVEILAGVATVTVDNPPVNALDDETLAGLGAAGAEIAERDDVRCAVLTGAGTRAFVAGADLAELASALGPDGTPGAMEHHVALTEPVFARWSSATVPTIAALDGDAVGGGLELALACDLIVAAPQVRVGLPEVKLGLMPGGGGTQRLARRIGRAAALEMTLLGRLLEAEAARQIGLVDRLADGDDGSALATAAALAARIAAQPAQAVRSVKRAVAAGADAGLSDGLAVERELFLAVAASSDAREGATAFLERRKPRFGHR